MPGVASRIGVNNDFILLFTRRNLYEEITILPVSDFKAINKVDPVTTEIIQVVVVDNDLNVPLINVNSDAESIELYGISINDLWNEIINGL